MVNTLVTVKVALLMPELAAVERSPEVMSPLAILLVKPLGCEGVTLNVTVQDCAFAWLNVNATTI